MNVVFLIGTAIGWAMIGHVVTKHAIRWSRQRRLQRPSEAEARLERIARLELACGVGLMYGRDAVMAAKVRVEPHMQELFYQGNGAVYRDCWSCGKRFRELDHERPERDGEFVGAPLSEVLGARTCRTRLRRAASVTPCTVNVVCARTSVKVGCVPAVRYGYDAQFRPLWRCSFCGARVKVVA